MASCRSFVGLLLLMLCWVLCPSPVRAEGQTIGVFWTDGSGVLSSRAADHWNGFLARALAQTDGPAVTLVPASDRALSALSTLPDLLVASNLAPREVSTPWVLVIEVGPDDAPAVHAHLVNVQHKAFSYQSNGAHITAAGWTQVARFIRQGLDEAAHDATQPVACNQTSRIYHKRGATDIQGETLPMDSPEQARAEGFHPCPVCFPASAGDSHDPTETALGDDVTKQIMRRYTVSCDASLTARVDRVGQRLLEKNGISDFPYSFSVLDSHQANAFSAGAGHVFITSRLLHMLSSDDELAGVLGHEIGHCECHHVLRCWRQSQTVSLVGVVLSYATGSSMGEFVSDFVGSFITRGFNRTFELEADYRGLLYAHVAGYHADAFVLALRKLEETTGQSGAPEWLNTHPDSANRIQEAERELAALDAYDRQTDAIRPVDQPLAAELRRGIVLYMRQPQRLRSFLDAYQGLVPAALSAPAPGTIEARPDVGRGE